jgi:Tol biopolymer transport system component
MNRLPRMILIGLLLTLSVVVPVRARAQPALQNDRSSAAPDISADGRIVVFESKASDLVENDKNGLPDIFARDLQTGKTALVSIGSTGMQVFVEGARTPAISGNGRYVAFVSRGLGLIENVGTLVDHIYIHDRETGKTTRASINNTGAPGNRSSGRPALSADGRFVVFLSEASNLVEGDTNDQVDIFVHDREKSTTERVSISSDGTQSDDFSTNPAISGDGRYVAFESDAANLAAGANYSGGLYLHDRQTRQTILISLNTKDEGTLGFKPSLSGDGRFVVFESRAGDLVEGDTNDHFDLFLYDRETKQITRITQGIDGTQANEGSTDAAISADGSTVVFRSLATNLVEDDTNATYDIFAVDVAKKQITRVSVNANGEQAGDASFDPAVSGDGQVIAFGSNASNLVAGDSTEFFDTDIFVIDRQTKAVTRVSATR